MSEAPRTWPQADLEAVLRKALTMAGFHSFRLYWRGRSLCGVFAQVEAYAHCELANNASRQSHPSLSDVLAEVREMVQPTRREFPTLLARK